jgi:hypothetical protein
VLLDGAERQEHNRARIAGEARHLGPGELSEANHNRER